MVSVLGIILMLWGTYIAFIWVLRPLGLGLGHGLAYIRHVWVLAGIVSTLHLPYAMRWLGASCPIPQALAQ